MGKKLLKQTGLALLVVLAFFLAGHSKIPVLERGADGILSHMAVSYTAEDLKKAWNKVRKTTGYLTEATVDGMDVMMGRPTYSDPIDESYEGNITPVYAAGGGQITAVGENEEIGKYVKITHGDRAESLYGNLKTVKVAVPSNVKKGQIIGMYDKRIGKDFYYSFKEFR